MARLLIPLCLLALAPAVLGAQQRPAPVVPEADTVLVDDAPSATGAMLRSFVLPGWGQAYVGVPGRGSVYFALEAGSLWMTYKSWQALDQARVGQQALRDAGLLEDDETSGLVRSRERQREDWITLSVFVLLLSGADAYVAAKLADFVEHLDIEAGEEQVQLQLSVPVGRVR